MKLYDYLYVNLEKAVSLYSQLTGGVVELRESQVDWGKTADNKRKYDFKVFKHDAGGTTTDSESVKEVIKPYHSFLIELEQALEDQGFLITLGDTLNSLSLRDPDFRKTVAESFAIKVTGRCVIEDYERIKRVSAAFPDVVDLINKSAQTSLKNSEEYKEIERQLEEAEQQVKSVRDRNKRNEANLLVKRQKHALADLLSKHIGVVAPDKWLLDGLQTWINTFLPGIVNLRVYPSLDLPDEQVFGHLKKEYFCDDDPESLHFTYGSKPTAKITVLGVVAAVPTQEEDDFEPLREFDRDELSDTESVEKAFRGVFRGFDGFEQMIRTCRFPRIVVYPVLVYRTAKPNKTVEATS